MGTVLRDLDLSKMAAWQPLWRFFLVTLIVQKGSRDLHFQRVITLENDVLVSFIYYLFFRRSDVVAGSWPSLA